MDRSTHICVVGAGAAGLTVADTLHGLGYRKVTVLEREPDRVGGKCFTVDMDGLKVDRGAVYVLPSYPAVRGLLHREALATRRASPLVHVSAGGETRPFGTPPSPIPLREKLTEFGRLGVLLVKHRRLLRGALGDATPAALKDLSKPFAAWVKDHRLRFLNEVAGPMLRAFGLGLDEHEVPAIYALKVLPQLTRNGNPLSLWSPEDIELDHVEGGFGELWRRVARGLDVQRGAAITRVERTDVNVTVHTGSESIGFDHIVLACPLDEALAFLDATPEEKELFGAIRWVDLWQAVARVEGIGEALLLDKHQTLATAGHVVGLFRYFADEPLYYLVGYGGEGIDQAAIERNIRDDIEAVGGRVVGDVTLKRWKYLPHFASSDVEAGFHARLEALQGQRRTWYAGDIMASIGVESATSYAQRLAERAFGPTAASARAASSKAKGGDTNDKDAGKAKDGDANDKDAGKAKGADTNDKGAGKAKGADNNAQK